ncbi:MAG: GNAT family N-acetyltransferase [Clostridia bacterium]|nr:GNAT family N-acetyltransferase [Clostridia bacterium]
MVYFFRAYQQGDVSLLTMIWNDVLNDGREFARIEPFTEREFADFLAKQTAVTCITVDGVVAGFYILHPNDEGRRAHVANASFAMRREFRGQHLGKPLVAHCIQQAKDCGFKGMQFNAVVADNAPALHIYESLGFQRIGAVSNGFLMKDGTYRDLIIMYLLLE